MRADYYRRKAADYFGISYSKVTEDMRRAILGFMNLERKEFIVKKELSLRKESDYVDTRRVD